MCCCIPIAHAQKGAICYNPNLVKDTSNVHHPSSDENNMLPLLALEALASSFQELYDITGHRIRHILMKYQSPFTHAE